MDRWRGLSNIQKGAIVGVLALILIGTIVTITVLATRNTAQTPNLVKTDKSSEMVDNLNKDVDPCQNFYEYACGNYKKKHPVKSAVESSSYFLIQDTHVQEKANEKLLQDVPKEKETAPEAYIRALFKKCKDEKAPDNFDKLKNKVNEIFNDKDSLIQTMAKVNRLGLPSLLSVAVSANPYYTKNHMFMVGPAAASGSLLEKIFETLRKPKVKAEENPGETPVYKFILETLKIFHGKEKNDDDMKKEANEIYNMTGYIANLSNYTAPTELEKQFKNFTLKDLNEATDDQFNWKEYLEAFVDDKKITIDDDENISVLVNEEYLTNISVLMKHNKTQITNYLRWSLIAELGFFSGSKFQDIEWNYQKAQLEKVGLPTTDDTRKKWADDKCYATINKVGDIVARMYIDEIAKEDKNHGKVLVDSIKATFTNLINENDWLDKETKTKALEKLGNITVNVGYPDWLLEEGELEKKYPFLKKDDLTDKATLFDLAFKLQEEAIADLIKSLRKEVKLDQEWPISPLLTNAVYSPLQNSITIPISILRGVFFNKDYPKYVNYAQLGAIIGHELTHAFDNQGSQTDEQGNIKNWWSKKTHEEFEKRTKCLVDQYSKDEYIVTKSNQKIKINLNGTKTLGENIADNGGVREAFKAWNSARNGAVEAEFEGLESFSEEQLFFISYANNWCSDDGFLALLMKLKDVHSPSRSRVNDVLANSKSFADAFKCNEGTPMNPKDKCKVW